MKTNRISIYVAAVLLFLAYGMYLNSLGFNEVANKFVDNELENYELKDSNGNYAIYADEFGHSYYRIKYDDGSLATEGYTDKNVTIYEVSENTLKLEISDGRYISNVTYFNLDDKSLARYNDYILYEEDNLVVYFNTNHIVVESLFDNSYKKDYYVNVTMPESIVEVLKLNEHVLNIKVMIDEVEKDLYVGI